MSNKSLAKPHKETCILVTGGAGFIGSHTCVELLERGYRVVVVDDLSNSSETAIERVRAITGTGVPEQRDRLTFYQENVLDRNGAGTRLLHARHRCRHPFCRLQGRRRKRAKALGILLEQRRRHAWCCATWRARTDAKNLVFSSSATVYGEPEFVPITEECPKHEATNPYGQTKSMLEQHLVRPVHWRPRMERRAAALLQPHRSTRKRAYRRGPQGHPQQPAALRGAGGRGQAGMRRRVRRRLSHS